jgi:hypothetical protein
MTPTVRVAAVIAVRAARHRRLRFRGWSFYDAHEEPTNNDHVPSQYPLLLHPNAGPLRFD